MFQHKFTNEMQFRSSFDKIKCFRVIDHEGKVVNPAFDNQIDKQELLDIYTCMVRLNEADSVFL